ncbi:MAG: hypothetical protein AAFP69_20920, partial [Planctomycetota bacterium]
NKIGRWKPANAILPPDTELETEVLKSLSAEDQARVRTRLQQFERTGPETRDGIVQVDAVVMQQPDAAQLIETLRRYGAWRSASAWESNLGERSVFEEIESMEGQQRTDALIAELENLRSRWRTRSADILNDDDVINIYSVLKEEIAPLRLDGRVIQRRIRDMMRRFTTPEERVLVLMYFAQRRPNQLPMEVRGLSQPMNQWELEFVRSQLSDEKQEKLAIMAEIFAEDAYGVLEDWCMAAIERKLLRPMQPESELRTYEALSPQRRELLDHRSPEEILNSLQPRRL